MQTKCEFQGTYLGIHVMVLDDGSSPVQDFLNGLEAGERRRVDALFDLLGSNGQIRNKEQFKKIESSNLFEFKRFQIRLICFFTSDKKVVICHALRKKKDKHSQSDLDYAERMRKKFLGIK